MDANTADGWRDLFTFAMGMYLEHKRNGVDLSTRMLRRRINGITEAQAEFLVAMCGIIGRNQIKGADDVLSVEEDDNILPSPNRRRLA